MNFRALPAVSMSVGPFALPDVSWRDAAASLSSGKTSDSHVGPPVTAAVPRVTDSVGVKSLASTQQPQTYGVIGNQGSYESGGRAANRGTTGITISLMDPS